MCCHGYFWKKRRPSCNDVDTGLNVTWYESESTTNVVFYCNRIRRIDLMRELTPPCVGSFHHGFSYTRCINVCHNKKCSMLQGRHCLKRYRYHWQWCPSINYSLRSANNGEDLCFFKFKPDDGKSGNGSMGPIPEDEKKKQSSPSC